MEIALPVINEKRNTVTDLKYKNFLFVQFDKNNSEKEILKNLNQLNNTFIKRAKNNRLPQIQIRFPYTWHQLEAALGNLGYHAGLFEMEKTIKGVHFLPEKVEKLDDTSLIKDKLVIQQNLHFHFNPIFFSDPKKFDFDEYLNDFQEKIDRYEAELFVLINKGKINGFIGLEAEKKGVYINELFVEPEHRGKGIGKILMQAAFHYSTKFVSKTIWTTLASQNDIAFHFYKSCRFKTVYQINFFNLFSNFLFL